MSHHDPVTKVKNWVYSEIVRGSLRRGMALPPERHLAHLCGVSRASVRGALLDLQGSGELEWSEGGRHRRVATRDACGPILGATILVIGGPTTVGSAADPSQESLYPKARVMAELESAHLLPMGLAAHPSGDIVRRFRAEPAAGAIVLAENGSDTQRRTTAATWRALMPTIVQQTRNQDLPAVDRVVSDHAGGCAALVEELTQRGCRRILRLWLTGPPVDELPWLQARDEGYLAATAALGLEALPSLHIPLAAEAHPTPSARFTYRAALIAGHLTEYCLPARRIDAILVATDRHAYEVAAALRRLGIGPNQDVLLAGYDHLAGTLALPQEAEIGPLLTVDKQVDALAQTLITVLQDRLRDPGALPRCVSSPHRLVDLSAPETAR